MHGDRPFFVEEDDRPERCQDAHTGLTAAESGLPCGLMIIGTHVDDADVLRVADTYEQAVGGFPRPPDS
jgi:hypothetical protein